MSWLETYNLQFLDYSYLDWTYGIKLGYIIYFSKEDGVKIIDTHTYNLVFHDHTLAGAKLYYYIFDNNLFFSVNNAVFEYNFKGNNLNFVCDTIEDHIWLANSSIAVGATYSRKLNLVRNEIIHLPDCSIIYKWLDKSGLIFIETESFSIFKNDFDSTLKLINIQNGNLLWELPLLGFSSPRFYKSISKEIFLIMQSFNTEHPTDKRYELWGINKYSGEVIYKTDVAHFDRFTYCSDNKRLYGLNGQMYLSIDPFSGAILSKKQVELGEIYQRQWISLGNQSITGNEIFFTLSGKPIVGRFNIANETIDEFIEINVDANKVDMRQPLNMPYYYKGKLYVRDNSGVMHILERKDYPASS
ncbi:MAG: hypothetical protein M9911_15350 [Saprospiraceae bacterium]|nr:hypothetical protein [Saprospiraceae bacterium]